MTRFGDRLEESTYQKDERVSLGIARAGGEPEPAINIPERLFARLQHLAEGYDLHVLPSIDPYLETRLNLAQVQSLAEELDFLTGLSTHPLVLRSIAAVAEVAARVTRSPVPLELVVVGP